MLNNLHVFSTTAKLVVSAAIIFGWGSNASAETVRVGTGASQAHGHGYVFGSSTDATCWLAAPAHVLENAEGDLVDQIVINREGDSGVATNAFRPDEAIDLAFAEIKGLGQHCVDRLSSRNLDGLLEVGTEARLNLTNSNSGGAKTLPLRIRSVDGGGDASYFSVEPVESAADKNPKIIQGYSGGVIDKNGSSALGGGDQVLGLILNVCDGSSEPEVDFDNLFDESANAKTIVCSDGHYATVIRMDTVKSLFETAQQNSGVGPEKSQKKRQPTLLNFTKGTISGDPSSLLTGDDCWTVDTEDKDPIMLDYRILEGENVSRVTVTACDNSNTLRGVEIRGGQTASDTKPYRYCPANSGVASCSIGLRLPTVLSLRIAATKGSAVSIRSVLIE